MPNTNISAESVAVAPAAVIAQVASFAYRNPQGGTGMSNWPHNKAYAGSTAQVQLVKCWIDSETGLRFIGKSHHAALSSYLDQVAAPDDQSVFFSEHDLENPQQARTLVEQFAAAIGFVQTSDGYRFCRCPDGSWTDGDITFPNFSTLSEESDITVQATPGNALTDFWSAPPHSPTVHQAAERLSVQTLKEQKC